MKKLKMPFLKHFQFEIQTVSVLVLVLQSKLPDFHENNSHPLMYNVL